MGNQSHVFLGFISHQVFPTYSVLASTARRLRGAFHSVKLKLLITSCALIRIDRELGRPGQYYHGTYYVQSFDSYRVCPQSLQRVGGGKPGSEGSQGREDGWSSQKQSPSPTPIAFPKAAAATPNSRMKELTSGRSWLHVEGGGGTWSWAK